MSSENLRERVETALVRTRLDPQALIAVAIEKGAGIETLERLVQLAKDVREITAREAWHEAMAEFQRKCPSILKTKTARIQTRTGGTYSYAYAPLDEILGTIQPVMGELGLSVSWRSRVEQGAVVANCWIAHKLGHHEESGDVVMPFQNDGRMNPAQVVGSASTYAKRYALLAIIGMAPEDDDDAGSTVPGESGKTPERHHTPIPASEIGDPGRPMGDPDAPGAKAEAARLFPTPEDDERGALLAEIQSVGAKLTKLQRGRVKEMFLGSADADVTEADVAALEAILKHLREMK